MINKLIIPVYSHILLLAAMLAFTLSSFSQEMDKIIDLKGVWKFSIGDNPAWASPAFNDSQWEGIYVQKNWEGQGFNGYDGFAWYRKSFLFPALKGKTNYYLQLGYIDDVDEVYLNGNLIGQTGSFPPNFATAYNANRIYSVPESYFNKSGNNLLAVRVYDAMGEGGIIQGNIGLMAARTPAPDFDLQGKWKFKTSNVDVSNLAQLNFESWGDIVVPGLWDNQGFKYFDGIATYVKEFTLNGEFQNKKMVLLLGKIDDIEQVYVNGTLIFQNGNFDVATVNRHSQSFRQFRGYYLPEGVLNDKGKNILIVKVLDASEAGGIYEGPIGLITQENYIQFWRTSKKY